MTDEYWMQQAIQQAELAEQAGEVPVGAVLVKDQQLLAAGFNQMISLNDPSAHAEMQAVRQAGTLLKNYRLIDCTLYVTLEPCTMCAGMLVHSRVSRLVYGANDYKTGAAGSVLNLVQHPQFNHQLQVTAGVLAEQCGAQLSAFFQRRRQEKKRLKQQAMVSAQQSALHAETEFDNCVDDDAI